MKIRLVPGFPGYAVSEFGHVFRDGEMLDAEIDAYGYAKVTLRKKRNGRVRRVTRRVCEIVACAFCGVSLDKPRVWEIRHRNGSTSDNHYTNLIRVPASPHVAILDKRLRGMDTASRIYFRREYIERDYFPWKKLSRKSSIR